MRPGKVGVGVLFGLWLLSMLAGCSPAGVAVREAWARPGVQGGTSAVYFLIENDSSQADAVTGVESPAAGMAQLHRSSMDASGTMMMEEQEQVDLPAGEEVSFEPGGLHVMLMDLTGDLDPGDTLSVTLTFQNREPITLEVTVREP